MTPAIADTVCFTMIEHSKLSGIGLSSGTTAIEIATSDPASAPPVIDGDELFLASWNSNLQAFRLPNVAPLWSTYVYPPDSVKGDIHTEWGLTEPSVDAIHVVFGSQDGSLYCLDRATGILRWKVDMSAVVTARPLLLVDVVYVTAFDSALTAVDLVDGAVLWRLPLGESVEYSGPREHHGDLYFAGSSGSVFRVDPKERRIVWQARVGQRFRTAVAVTPDLVCAADESGTYGLDPESGNIRWTRSEWGENPVIDGHHVFLTTRNAAFFVLDVHDGSTVASHAIEGGGFFCAPLPTSDRVVVGTTEGRVYCFARPPEVEHGPLGRKR